MRRVLVFVATVLISASLLAAQEATGTMSGTIVDSSQSAVTGAMVVVTNIDTKASRRLTTDEHGIYRASALPPGKYTVSVSKEGFKTMDLTDLDLQVNQVLTADAQLQVGGVSETVTVQGEAPLVQSETTTLGHVVESKTISELPLNGRQFLQLTTLVPGTVGGYTRDISRQGGSRASSAINIAVNGSRSEFNNYLLDGILNTDENYNTYLISPSVDALQEFKVQTSTYSAQYGRGGGAQINIITKSGSNELHGVLFEFLRNADLDAKNFFDRSSQPIPPFKQNQFGGTIGGPLRIPKLYDGRNRTFFFFNYEGFRNVRAQSSISTVPTAAMRGGDFSGLSAIIYDPATGRPSATNPSVYVRTPFARNIIPTNRLNQTSLYLLQYDPLPNLPGLTNNYISNESSRNVSDQYTGRIDHQITTNNTLFGRYSISDESTYSPGALPQTGTNLNVRAQSVVLGDTHVFGPRTVNEARFGFIRLYNALLQANAYTLDAVGAAGITGLSRSPIDFGIPNVSLQGFTTFGDQANSFPSLLRDNTFQYLDNLTLNRGRHSISVGFEFRRYQFNNFANNYTRGTYSFTSPLFTSNPATGNSGGSGLADLLLGTPAFVQGSIGDTAVYMRRSSYNGYVQDDIRVLPRLTINLGIRYELNPYPVDKYDRIETVDLSTSPPTLVRAGTGDPYYFYPNNIIIGSNIPYVRDGRFGRSLLQTNKNNWAPRVGLAWSPDDRTVVRTAYGMYYAQDIGNVYFDLARNVPRSINASLLSDTNVPQLSMTGAFQGLTSGQSALAPTLVMVDSHYPTSYVQQWNFNLQRQVTRTILIEAGYVGSKGTDLGLLNLFNLAPPGPGASQTRRPYPQYGRIFLFQHNTNSTYNAFQARIEKRYSAGLSFLGSYTLGKSLDYDSSSRTSGESNRPIDPTNLRREHGRSLFDARHNLVVSALEELPFGAGKPWMHSGGFAAAILGGWQLNAIYEVRTGLPFTVGASGDIANTGNDASGRANYVGGDAVLPDSLRGPNRWFKTAAFATPAAYTFGNAGRNILDGPSLQNVDLSVFREFHVHESVRLQFRSEFFDLTNTPHFGQPNSTVNGSGFGTITSAAAPRQIQFALKLFY